MEESLVMKKLMNVDRELHSLIDELRSTKQKKISLSEINKLMLKDRISDKDSTELIREMRNKRYAA